MKLKQLFESSKQDELVKFLEACRPYIERCMEVSGHRFKRLLFHGTNNVASSLKEVPFKLRNAGRDTPRRIFDALNNSMAEMFGGLQPRRWLFVSCDPQVARNYGENTALVFPTGHNFQWFKIRNVTDLFAALNRDMHEAGLGAGRVDDITMPDSEAAESFAYRYLDYRFDESDFILNRNFGELFRNEDEIMLYGDTFYTVAPGRPSKNIRRCAGYGTHNMATKTC